MLGGGGVSESVLRDGLRKAGFKVFSVDNILKEAGSQQVFDSIYKRAWSAAYVQDSFMVTPWGYAGWWGWGYMEGGVEYHTPTRIIDFSKADLLLTGKSVVESAVPGRAVARVSLELVRLKKDSMEVLAEGSAVGVGTGEAGNESQRALTSAADQALEQILGDLMESGSEKESGTEKPAGGHK